ESRNRCWNLWITLRILLSVVTTWAGRLASGSVDRLRRRKTRPFLFRIPVAPVGAVGGVGLGSLTIHSVAGALFFCSFRRARRIADRLAISNVGESIFGFWRVAALSPLRK